MALLIVVLINQNHHVSDIRSLCTISEPYSMFKNFNAAMQGNFLIHGWFYCDVAYYYTNVKLT